MPVMGSRALAQVREIADSAVSGPWRHLLPRPTDDSWTRRLKKSRLEELLEARRCEVRELQARLTADASSQAALLPPPRGEASAHGGLDVRVVGARVAPDKPAAPTQSSGGGESQEGKGVLPKGAGSGGGVVEGATGPSPPRPGEHTFADRVATPPASPSGATTQASGDKARCGEDRVRSPLRPAATPCAPPPGTAHVGPLRATASPGRGAPGPIDLTAAGSALADGENVPPLGGTGGEAQSRPASAHKVSATAHAATERQALLPPPATLLRLGHRVLALSSSPCGRWAAVLLASPENRRPSEILVLPSPRRACRGGLDGGSGGEASHGGSSGFGIADSGGGGGSGGNGGDGAGRDHPLASTLGPCYTLAVRTPRGADSAGASAPGTFSVAHATRLGRPVLALSVRLEPDLGAGRPGASQFDPEWRQGAALLVVPEEADVRAPRLDVLGDPGALPRAGTSADSDLPRGLRAPRLPRVVAVEAGLEAGLVLLTRAGELWLAEPGGLARCARFDPTFGAYAWGPDLAVPPGDPDAEGDLAILCLLEGEEGRGAGGEADAAREDGRGRGAGAPRGPRPPLLAGAWAGGRLALWDSRDGTLAASGVLDAVPLALAASSADVGAGGTGGDVPFAVALTPAGLLLAMPAAGCAESPSVDPPEDPRLAVARLPLPGGESPWPAETGGRASRGDAGSLSPADGPPDSRPDRTPSGRGSQAAPPVPIVIPGDLSQGWLFGSPGRGVPGPAVTPPACVPGAPDNPRAPATRGLHARRDATPADPPGARATPGWRGASGAAAESPPGSPAPATAMASSRGGLVALGRADGSVLIWDTVSGEGLARAPARAAAVVGLGLSGEAGDRRLVVAWEDGQVLVQEVGGPGGAGGRPP